MTIGLLGELREVMAAALLASGRAVDDLGSAALDAVWELLAECMGHVVRVSSEHFVGAVLQGVTSVHHTGAGRPRTLSVQRPSASAMPCPQKARCFG